MIVSRSAERSISYTLKSRPATTRPIWGSTGSAGRSKFPFWNEGMKTWYAAVRTISISWPDISSIDSDHMRRYHEDDFHEIRKFVRARCLWRVLNPKWELGTSSFCGCFMTVVSLKRSCLKTGCIGLEMHFRMGFTTTRVPGRGRCGNIMQYVSFSELRIWRFRYCRCWWMRVLPVISGCCCWKNVWYRWYQAKFF